MLHGSWGRWRGFAFPLDIVPLTCKLAVYPLRKVGMNEQAREAVEHAEQIRADDARHREHRQHRGPSLRPSSVAVIIPTDDARELYERLLNGPVGCPAWEWRVLVELADALGETLPEWMREKATA